MTCPHCGLDHTLQVRSRYVADAGAVLAGARLRLPLHMPAVLSCCSCGWYTLGHLEDAALSGDTFTTGVFVADAPPIRP
jgi:hypothetical protein